MLKQTSYSLSFLPLTIATPAPPPGSPSLGSPPGLPPVPPNVAMITSPLMFGMLLDWTLFGVLPVQVCKPVPLPFKSAPTTYAMQIFITFASLRISECSHDLFCTGYGNLIKLSNAYISMSYGLMMSAVISVIIQ
ncbi:hypothetical protein JB92DRAFT_3093211, partial [Gautieria morchelliformis]